MRVRCYGDRGPAVVLLHGGPAAPGTMAPVARALAPTHRVWEPFQRGAGTEPLTVATHVDDLRALLDERLAGERPTLIGASWGAMLALAFAAAHPQAARSVVLIGCGTFDPASRAVFQRAVERRCAGELAVDLAALNAAGLDPDERMARMGALLLPAFSHDVLSGSDLELQRCDARAHHETWQDMLGLQERDVYPAAFAAIGVPVLMLHGEADPHPGASTRDVLRRYVPGLEYRELARCGHYPWLERRARDGFFAGLCAWLRRVEADASAGP
ncbi:MAG: alpha/beta hydrolase [Planctomycetota bacterium]